MGSSVQYVRPGGPIPVPDMIPHNAPESQPLLGSILQVTESLTVKEHHPHELVNEMTYEFAQDNMRLTTVITNEDHRIPFPLIDIYAIDKLQILQGYAGLTIGLGDKLGHMIVTEGGYFYYLDLSQIRVYTVSEKTARVNPLPPVKRMPTVWEMMDEDDED